VLKKPKERIQVTRIKLRHVDSFRDRHGTERWYFRRGHGGRVPLPGTPGSAEFAVAYDAALKEGGLPPRPELREGKSGRELGSQSGYIYFLRVSGSIKIGFSTRPTSRITELKTGLSADYDTAVIVRGTLAQEKFIHKRLAPHRVRGEWYKPSPEVEHLMLRAATAGVTTCLSREDEQRAA
jgi:hypothetical protein